MIKKIFAALRPILKSLVVVGLVFTLVLGQAHDAYAASRSGGRMGGGSFRAPTRTYSAPRPRQPAPSVPYGGGYGGYGYGGGFGFPFMMPFFGGWGFAPTGLFTTLIIIAIAGYLVQSFRKFQSEGGEELDLDNPAVSVTRLQVGLLAQARELQTDLERIALSANTGSTEGLVKLLQDTSLALMRHPEYWVYAGSDSELTRLNAAEAQFNRFSLSERSKFTVETLSNYNSQLQQAGARTALLEGDQPLTHPKGSGEYIVVTVIVGAQGKLQLPVIRNTDDLRMAINQLGAVGSDQLLAVEVLWTPEAKGDVLTSDDMIVGYPQLKMI
jgi:uncharacterized membrane protein